MNLFNNKEILKSLLRQSDILNTINGGTAMTRVASRQENGNLIISISAASVPADAYNIILNQNNLIVFSVLALEAERNQPEELMNVPFFTRNFALPANVSGDGIEAFHERGELRIIIPLESRSPTHARRIRIKQI